MVNPNEAPEGYIAVIQENAICKGCSFWHRYKCVIPEGFTSCIDCSRKDNQTVIFVKKM